MKIAIAANENNIHSPVAVYFGKCGWYCIYDTRTKSVDFIANEMGKQREKAGRDAVDFLSGMGVGVVVAGRFGTKVMGAFRNEKIQMVIPEENKTINKIIHQIK